MSKYNIENFSDNEIVNEAIDRGLYFFESSDIVSEGQFKELLEYFTSLDSFSREKLLKQMKNEQTKR